MSRIALVILLFSCLPAAGAAPPEARDPDGQPYLDKYLEATRGQDDKLRGLNMVCDIEASLPGMNKKGKFHALRQISKLGQITYRTITFQGDNTIKNDVIARYLHAEKEAAEKKGGGFARTPENYKFRYYGEFAWGDGKVHLFELSPRKKDPGLFQGWLWIDDRTGLPVREQGTLSKNPSVFLKRVEFVRDYELRDGLAVPVKVDSTIQTRIVGRAEMSIRYSNVEPVSPTAAEPPPNARQEADSR